MRDKRQSGIEERAKDVRRKEFDIITKYGARNTRWETVKDVARDKLVTINVDTMRVHLFFCFFSKRFVLGIER